VREKEREEIHWNDQIEWEEYLRLKFCMKTGKTGKLEK
jgi:hypothetical protein